jgi:excisionase family DNA binding protein
MTTREQSQPEYLTVEEVSGLLKLGESTVRRRIRSGEIPAVRLASRGRGLVRVPRDELEAWLRSDPRLAA